MMIEKVYFTIDKSDVAFIKSENRDVAKKNTRHSDTLNISKLILMELLLKRDKLRTINRHPPNMPIITRVPIAEGINEN